MYQLLRMILTIPVPEATLPERYFRSSFRDLERRPFVETVFYIPLLTRVTALTLNPNDGFSTGIWN